MGFALLYPSYELRLQKKGPTAFHAIGPGRLGSGACPGGRHDRRVMIDDLSGAESAIAGTNQAEFEVRKQSLQ
jgi:hypothetical protein